MIKAVGYIRVSTPDQKIKISPEHQRESIRDYIENQGWQLATECGDKGFYEDLGISGGGMVGRIGLQELLADAVKCKFQKVTVAKMDRFGRDLGDMVVNRKILEEAEIDLVSATEYYDGTYDGDFKQGIDAVVAQREKDRIKERVLEGKTKMLQNGAGTVGRLPFARYYERDERGKRKYEAGIKLNEDLATKIRYAADEYLSGRSLKEIAKEVEMKYFTLLTVLKNQSGSAWTITYQPQKKIKWLRQPITEILTIPRILSDQKIKRIMEMVDRNRCFDRWQKNEKYPFSNFLKCRRCGRGLSGQDLHDIKYYRHPVDDECKAFAYIRADYIEEKVLNLIFIYVKDEPAYKKAIQSLIVEKEDLQALDWDIGRKEKQLKGKREERDNLVEAVKKGVKPEIVNAEHDRLTEEIAELEKGVKGLREKRDTCSSKEKLKEAEKMRQRLLKYFQSEERIRSMSYLEKRALFHHLFDGQDEDGNAYGIFVEKSRAVKKGWNIFIKARLFTDSSFPYDKELYEGIKYRSKESIRQKNSLKALLAEYELPNKPMVLGDIFHESPLIFLWLHGYIFGL